MVPVVTSLQDGSKWPLFHPHSHGFVCDYVSRLCVHFVSRLICMTKRIWEKWWHMTFKARSSKTLQFLPCSWIAHSRESQLPYCRLLKQLSGEVHVVKNGGPLPTTIKNLRSSQQLSKWAILEADPSPPGKSSEYCNSRQHLACNLTRDSDPEPPR